MLTFIRKAARRSLKKTTGRVRCNRHVSLWRPSVMSVRNSWLKQEMEALSETQALILWNLSPNLRHRWKGMAMTMTMTMRATKSEFMNINLYQRFTSGSSWVAPI
jgi:hypothetical protein